MGHLSSCFNLDVFFSRFVPILLAALAVLLTCCPGGKAWGLLPEVLELEQESSSTKRPKATKVLLLR